MVDFTRWFLAVFFGGVAGFYTLRILLMKRHLSRSPVFSGSPGTLHFATHLVFRLFRVLILSVCLLRLWWPPLDSYLLPFKGLWHPGVLMTGNVLLAGSFSAVVAIHLYMGESWRSGTREDSSCTLVTTGPFAISRNPMMLCVMAAQMGLFLALPSVFTLVCLAAGLWAVIAQVSIEERLLRQRLGKVYEDYSVRTPRWLRRPWSRVAE